MHEEGSKLHRIATAAFLLSALIGLALVWFLFPVRDWIDFVVGWVRSTGLWGILAFAVVYVVLVIALAPAEIMTIAAGLIFGAWGFPLVVISATIGAALSFLLARYLARDFVQKHLERRPLYRALDRAVEREGWKLVALFRLNPLIPFNLQNYFFGVTAISFRSYSLATFFGTMPGTAAYLYFGTLGRIATGVEQPSEFKFGLVIIGFIATIIMVVLLTRTAKQKLRELHVNDNG